MSESVQKPKSWRLATPVMGLFYGGEPIFSCSGKERAARCLVTAFVIALPLFVAVELSPTPWALATALAVVLAHPRGLAEIPLDKIPARQLLGWIALLILTGISATWSLDRSRSWHAALVFAAYLCAGTILVGYIIGASESQRQRIWTAVVVGASIALVELTAIEIYSIATGWDAVRTFHKITFYGLLAAAILLKDEQNKPLLRMIFLLSFFAIPTLLIGKTSGVNLMIFISILLWALSPRLRPKLLLTVFSVYALFALLAPFIAGQIYRLADRSFFAAFREVATFMARLDLWHLMAPFIFERPWLGHGADTVRVSGFIIQDPKYYDLPDLPSAHNMIFDQWYELGVIGVLLLLMILAQSLRDILRSRIRSSLTAGIFFLGFIVEFSVDHRLWLSWVQGTVVFAIAVVVLTALSQPNIEEVAVSEART